MFQSIDVNQIYAFAHIMLNKGETIPMLYQAHNLHIHTHTIMYSLSLSLSFSLTHTHTHTQSDMFQDDIYPPTFAGKAAQSAEEWISGQNKDPLLIAFSNDGLKELSAADSQVVSLCYISDHFCPGPISISKVLEVHT